MRYKDFRGGLWLSVITVAAFPISAAVCFWHALTKPKPRSVSQGPKINLIPGHEAIRAMRTKDNKREQ